MPESLRDRLRRKWKDARIKAAKALIRKSVEWLDRLQERAFMAYCWGIDENTDYHVLAERSYEKCHIYGTKVEYYDDGVSGDARQRKSY